MLQPLELDVINILSEQKAFEKEEIIIRINLEKQNEDRVGLGYRAFKLIMKNLERKSLIERLKNNSYQLTTLGEKELRKTELSIATS